MIYPNICVRLLTLLAFSTQSKCLPGLMQKGDDNLPVLLRDDQAIERLRRPLDILDVADSK
jgi:hypothetical protein